MTHTNKKDENFFQERDGIAGVNLKSINTGANSMQVIERELRIKENFTRINLSRKYELRQKDRQPEKTGVWQSEKRGRKVHDR